MILLILLVICNIITICSSTTKIDQKILDSILFYETFDSGDDIFTSGKWIKSNAEKFKEQPILIRPAKQPAAGFEDDFGLQLSQPNYHYGIIAPFKEPLKLDITISGLLPGMSEEQIKQLFIEGKLNEAVYNALKEAEKTKI